MFFVLAVSVMMDFGKYIVFFFLILGKFVSPVSSIKSGSQQLYYVLPSEQERKACPNDSNISCNTLSYYSELLFHQEVATEITYILLDGNYMLNSTIFLHNFSSISFIGQGSRIKGLTSPPKVNITCNSDLPIPAFTLDSIHHATFTGLTLMGCGNGFVLRSVTSFKLSFVTIQNSVNTGLLFTSNNINSSVKIYNSTFYRNCLQDSTDSHCSHVAIKSRNSFISINVTDAVFSTGVLMFAGLYLDIDNTSQTVSEEIHNFLHISRCLFINNSALSGGLNVRASFSKFFLVDSLFMGNVLRDYSDMPISGSGLTSNFFNSNASIQNSTFKSNKGRGAYIKTSCERKAKCTPLAIGDCIFERNNDKYGGGLMIVSQYAVTHLNNVSILSNNHQKKGIGESNNQYSALLLYCSSTGRQLVQISGLKVIGNYMTGLLSIKCVIIFTNETTLIANNSSPNNGGGIWLDNKSVIKSKKGIRKGLVKLINNTALKGGALYSDSSTLLQEAYPFKSASCKTGQLKGYFNGNRALLAGDDIYGGEVFECNDYNTVDSFFDAIQCDSSLPLLSMFSKSLSSTVSSDAVGVCLCTDTGSVNYTVRSIYREVYPGSILTIPLATVGMCGGISPNTLILQSYGINATLGDSKQQTGKHCQNFSYNLRQYGDENGKFTVGTIGLSSYIHDSAVTVNIKFLECPHGFQLKSGECICDPVLKDAGHIKCNISWTKHPIFRSNNRWLNYDQNGNCTVVHENCPVDYCKSSIVFLSLDDPDIQCTQNRSGTLCGGCKPGFSLMLGSNRCYKCDNRYSSLIIAFVVAGMVLVAFLFVTNLTVSVGTVNGLLFYANIVKVNGITFFPNGVGIPVLSQFIAWLNLDFGIETCFFNGMDGYWKAWLQFVFPIYIWLIVGIIIICSRYSGKISRLFGNNTVPVLATLILMSYSKILRSITRSLMFSTIKCNQEKIYVWSIDANINYFSIKHGMLISISLLFLLVGLVYTGLIFSSQWLQRVNCRTYVCCKVDLVFKLKPIIDAYTGPFKDRFRFWTGLLLIVRAIISSIFSYTTGSAIGLNNFIIVVSCIFLLWLSSGGIYRQKLVGHIEFLYLTNILLLSLITMLCNRMGWDKVVYVTGASVSFSLMIFLLTVIAHVYIAIRKREKYYCVRERAENRREDETELLIGATDDESDTDCYSPSVVVQKRESLIFDFEL